MTTMSGAIATTVASGAHHHHHQGGKVARVYEGWSDAQILALLQLFRARVLEYVYGGAERFASSVATHFPDKSETDIAEMMRALMSQFALAIDTKAFNNEVVSVDGQTVVVHLHLYETTASLVENKAGGVWHPDQLRRFFDKIRKYRDLLLRSADLFFSRVQISSKSVAHTQNKFYALHDLYEQEKKAAKLRARSELLETRFRALNEMFRDVRLPPRARDPTIFEKRPQLWSPKNLDMIIDLLVHVTLDIQKRGTSDLVPLVAAKLGRTEQSCINKLVDMRSVFQKKSSYSRAAHLPDTIFDTNSVAHKIFSSDWLDPMDPFAVGVRALKAHWNAMIAQKVRDRKRRAVAVAPLSTAAPATRKQRQAVATNQDARSSSSAMRARSSATSAPFTDFVCEMAQKYKWTEQRTRDVCAGMHQSLDLYRSRKLKAFYEAVMQATPGVSLTEMCFNGNAILKLFEARHNGLDAFGDIALGLAPRLPEPQPQASAPAHAAAAADTDMHDDEPAVSPSEVAESPLSFSDVERDDSSLEDEQPIDVDDDDDELDTISMDSVDNRSSSHSSGFKPRQTAYPSGQSYGKSDELVMKTVKAACVSCHARKRKKAMKKKMSGRRQMRHKQSSPFEHESEDDDDPDDDDDDEDDDDDDDDEEDDNDAQQQDESASNVHWTTLLQSLDAQISSLEARNRELMERKEDRERRQQRKQWRSNLQIEVLSTYQATASSSSA